MATTQASAPHQLSAEPVVTDTNLYQLHSHSLLRDSDPASRTQPHSPSALLWSYMHCNIPDAHPRQVSLHNGASSKIREGEKGASWVWLLSPSGL